MSVAAVMLVKDEADVIEHTIRHLATQVDEIIVQDNASTDGTREVLASLKEEGLVSTIFDDPGVAYYQARKTTWLADRAREFGQDWVIPVDADEQWVAADGRPIREWLLGMNADVDVVEAVLYHYIPTALDPDAEANPFRRIGWRLGAAAPLGKVAARTGPGLEILAGNHGARYDGRPASLSGGGLRVNHYSFRSPEQYARKIRNGARAYAATDLPGEVGPHWRMWGDPDAPDLELRAAAHFRKHFFAPDPPCAPGSADRNGLSYDPAVT